MNRPPTPLRIDVHSHIYPQPYLSLLETRDEIPRVIHRNGLREFAIFPEEVGEAGVGGRPMGEEYWSLDAKIDFMDRTGIDCSVVSLGNPWLDPFPNPDGDAMAGEINEILGKFEALTRGRVAGMGVLPTSSVGAAKGALKAIADHPGLHGIASGPKIAGLFLDDPGLDPFWDELARLDLPLFIHPVNGVALESLRGYRHTLPVGLGFPFETTIAVTRLIFGGVLERHPGLRLLVAHGGGSIPYLIGRLDAAWRSDAQVKSRLPCPPSTYARKLYLDGLVYHSPSLRAAISLAGQQKVMFGTDHPFSVSDPEGNLRMVAEELGSGEAYRAVSGENSRAFFNL